MPDESLEAGLGDNVNAYSSLLVIKEVNAISRAPWLDWVSWTAPNPAPSPVAAKTNPPKW